MNRTSYVAFLVIFIAIGLFSHNPSKVSAAEIGDDIWVAFLSLSPRTPVIPEDDDLGLLWDPIGGELAYVAVAEEFLTALAGGDIPEEIMDPVSAVPLTMFLQDALAAKPDIAGWRFAVPQRSSEGVAIPLRIHGGSGSSDPIGTTGTLFLRREGGNWRVVDLALDLTLLGTN